MTYLKCRNTIHVLLSLSLCFVTACGKSSSKGTPSNPITTISSCSDTHHYDQNSKQWYTSSALSTQCTPTTVQTNCLSQNGAAFVRIPVGVNQTIVENQALTQYGTPGINGNFQTNNFNGYNNSSTVPANYHLQNGQYNYQCIPYNSPLGNYIFSGSGYFYYNVTSAYGTYSSHNYSYTQQLSPKETALLVSAGILVSLLIKNAQK